MKSNIETPIVETSGFLKEVSFSVGDSSIIFDILRNKIYSNPIEAVVRELAANARDAHREIGKFDLPIKIQLPNAFEPELRIQDFGPGISPKRIEDIYIKYGVSTKREDNVQQGFFGIGAKSPFSMVNSFSIITITNHIKRSYCAFIDETRVGKIALTSEIPTDEENGTTIVIPVKREQVKQFEKAVTHFTQFWEIQPEIIGTISTPLPEIMLNCSLGKWVKFSEIDYDRNWNYRNLIALIDGIPYETEINSKIIINNSRNALCVNFDIGELTISASRDTLQLTEPTRQIIKDKVAKCEAELIKVLNGKINQSSTYKEAVELFTPMQNNIITNQLKWKDLPIYNFNNTINSWEQRLSIYSKFGKGKISRKDRSFKVGKYIRTVINDTKNSLSVKKVKKEFENNPEIERLQVITYLVDTDDCNKKEHSQLFRAALEALADGRIITAIKAAKKAKVIKKPKLIYSYLPNENKTNLVKTKFDYTDVQIYCPYNAFDNSVEIGGCFQINSKKRLKEFLNIQTFLNDKIVAWDNSAEAQKPPEHWIDIKMAMVEKFKTLPAYEDALFSSKYDLDYQKIIEKLSSVPYFAQLQSQIQIFEKALSNNTYYYLDGVRAIIRNILSQQEKDEIEKRSFSWKIANISDHFPLLDIVNLSNFKYSTPSQEAFQDLLTYLKSKEIK